MLGQRQDEYNRDTYSERRRMAVTELSFVCSKQTLLESSTLVSGILFDETLIWLSGSNFSFPLFSVVLAPPWCDLSFSIIPCLQWILDYMHLLCSTQLVHFLFPDVGEPKDILNIEQSKDLQM